MKKQNKIHVKRTNRILVSKYVDKNDLYENGGRSGYTESIVNKKMI